MLTYSIFRSAVRDQAQSMWDEEMQNMKQMCGNELAAAKEEGAQIKASYEEQVAAANEEIVQIKASYEKQFAAANEENAQVMATYDEEVRGLKVQLNNAEDQIARLRQVESQSLFTELEKHRKDVMARAASFCLEFEKREADFKSLRLANSVAIARLTTATTAHLKAQVESQSLDIDENDRIKNTFRVGLLCMNISRLNYFSVRE